MKSLIEMVVSELPMELKTVVYTILISFHRLKEENMDFMEFPPMSLVHDESDGVFRFKDNKQKNINTMVFCCS